MLTNSHQINNIDLIDTFNAQNRRHDMQVDVNNKDGLIEKSFLASTMSTESNNSSPEIRELRDDIQSGAKYL